MLNHKVDGHHYDVVLSSAMARFVEVEDVREDNIVTGLSRAHGKSVFECHVNLNEFLIEEHEKY